MADLPDKHATARRLIRGCEDALAKLEQAAPTTTNEALALDLDRRIKELQDVTKSMESILNSAFNMPPAQRKDWSRKVDSNLSAAASIQDNAARLKNISTRKRQEAQDMQSLLQGASRKQRNTLDSDAHSLGMAKQARRGVETMLDQAAGVLEGMGATRDTLKGTHKKLLDLANSVGISDRVLKLADRRNKGDAMIVYGGMAVLTVFVVVAVFWWK